MRGISHTKNIKQGTILTILLSVAMLSVIVIHLILPAMAQAITYPFVDDVENPASTFWVGDNPWGRTDSTSHSPIRCWADSPSANYDNNSDLSLTMTTSIDLTAGVNPQLKFWCKYQLEEWYDYLLVEISINNGAAWEAAALEEYSGNQNSWTREQIDLSPYGSHAQVKIRFRLLSDGSIVADGFYLDDIAIDDLPDAVVIDLPANITTNSLELSWSRSNDPVFSSYKLYRSIGNEGVNEQSRLIAAITDPNILTFEDTGLARKTRYNYCVYVVSNAEIYARSNETSGTTLIGIEYPFLDDMEAGPGNWLAGGDWSLISPLSPHSATKCWTDSPDGDYENDSDTSLTLASNISITGASRLTFWHKLAIGSGDQALVELSTNGGTDWDTMAAYTQDVADWKLVQLDLSGSPVQVLIRFRLVTDSSGISDGWYIDDVAMADLPTPAALSSPIPQPPPDIDKMALSWTQNTDADFEAYHIYRGSGPGVDPNGTLVTIITNQAVTGYTDTGLEPDTTYYYRVYVFNDYGICSGSNEEYAVTQIHGPVPYPIFDDMDSGEKFWEYDPPWGQTTEDAHSGVTCWTDSPGASYANSSDTSLRMSIKLGLAVMPVLTYWQRYALEENKDFGYVEVSTDKGGSWHRICFTTGTSAEWVEEKVDLAEYAGQAEVMIRFRLVSDASGYADGWYIDDVDIAETATPSLPYPLVDDLSSGTGNWLTGSWGIAGTGHDSYECITDSPVGKYLKDTDGYMRLILAGTIDLSGAVHPQLSFWHRYNFYYKTSGLSDPEIDQGMVYISDYYGQSQTWETLATYTQQSDWVMEQIDLSAYAGQSEVRIAFAVADDYGKYSSTYYYRQSDGWYIDDIRISEGPVDWCILSSPGICRTAPDIPTVYIYGQVYQPGVTDSAGQGMGIYAQLGYGPDGTDPGAGGWVWLDAEYCGDDGDNDEYRCTLTVPVTGTYDYCYRFSSDSYVWTYADLNGNDIGGGGSNGYDTAQAGYLTIVEIVRVDVSPDQDTFLEGATVQFDVTGYDVFNNPITLDMEDITWSVNGSIGTISQVGLFTSTGPGLGSIQALVSGTGAFKDVSGIIEILGPAGGTTQAESGYVYNSDSNVPDDEDILFNAYITARPTEILTQSAPGCEYSNGVWVVNIGNFATPWSVGETFHIDFINTALGEAGSLEYTLQYSGQSSDVTLTPISYDFITTPATDVNTFVLLKDCGVTDAEGLLNNIPNATQLGMWDASSQAYITHVKMTGPLNFDVTPGYPYFVTVTTDTTWTPSGAVPDPWPSYDLIITGSTDVNMMGMPLDKLRLTLAEEVCSIMPDLYEFSEWDTPSQSYITHRCDQPTFDFSVGPALAYFMTMSEPWQWEGLYEALTAVYGMYSKPEELSNVPQAELGRVYNADLSVPANGEIRFRAYIEGREDDVLTGTSPGCTYDQGYWVVNLGNFVNPWDAGEVLHIDYTNIANNQIGVLCIILEYTGQTTDVTLQQLSPCEGDFDMDGDVDGSNLATFAADFGRTDCASGPPCEGDFDDDGDVDGSDLAIFATDFGRTDCLRCE